jgi:CheY-specific phosphatase CheX
MKPINTMLDDDQLARLRELTFVGAQFGSSALGSVLGGHAAGGEPRFREPGDAEGTDRWATGIVFEAEGDLAGLVAIVLRAADRDLAVSRLVGRTDAGDHVATSALRELGNIIASHTVSGMADRLEATIMLSVPKLVMADAGEALLSLITQRGAQVRIEADLLDPEGDLHALLVFAPDPVEKN